MSTFEQHRFRARLRLRTFAGLVGLLLFVLGACGQAPDAGQAEILDSDRALNAGTTGTIHAVVTTEPTDVGGSLVQDIYIDADRNLAFMEEFGQDGAIERLVVIDGRQYREYLVSSDWLIERNYQSLGEGALNEITDVVFGYKEAIANNELTGVESAVIDDEAIVQLTYTRASEDFGSLEFVANLDATSLFPKSAVIRTTGLNGRDLARISYVVDPVASMPQTPEVPLTLTTGSERYSELSLQELGAFGDFTAFLPTSSLLDEYDAEILHHEVASSEEQSSIVSVYYWPEDRDLRQLAIPDLQVTSLANDSVDTTYLETNGVPVALSTANDAVEVRDGDGLLTITWSTEDGTRVSVFGNLQVFSESQVREIANSLKPAP